MYPDLPTDVRVLAGTDVAGEWERFEVFEALHHGMRICNPMTGADLDQLIERLQPRAGDRALDLACGHGELLIRMVSRHDDMTGVGIDLSPWVVTRAARHADDGGVSGRLQWILGNARDLPEDRYDIVTCLGASWIWHGFAGTVGAVTDRLNAGGRLAVGDLRLRDGADAAEVAETYGRVLTADEQAELLRAAGVMHLARLEPGDAAWWAYQDRIGVSARRWQESHPGPAADRYYEEQESWRADHDRDMRFLTWTVWTGQVP